MSDNDNNLTIEVEGSARIRLRHSELSVRPIGLGCMGMSQFYGSADDAQSVATIRTALDLGSISWTPRTSMELRTSISARKFVASVTTSN